MCVKVAICGAPLAGKHTVLMEIAKAVEHCQFKHFRIRTDPVTTVSVSENDISIHLKTLVGAIFYRPEMYQFLLNDADMVVYISSAAPYDMNQDKYLKEYLDAAGKFNKNWGVVPWLLVLNKTDKGEENPLLDRFPDHLSEGMIRIAAISGIGIRELYQKIVEIATSTLARRG